LGMRLGAPTVVPADAHLFEDTTAAKKLFRHKVIHLLKSKGVLPLLHNLNLLSLPHRPSSPQMDMQHHRCVSVMHKGVTPTSFVL
jgi:hypothetical protein